MEGISAAQQSSAAMAWWRPWKAEGEMVFLTTVIIITLVIILADMDRVLSNPVSRNYYYSCFTNEEAEGDGVGSISQYA